MEGIPVNLASSGGSSFPPRNGGEETLPPAGGGGSSGGGDNGNGRPKRFEQLVSGETKENVRTMLREDRFSITADQKRELIELLRSGQMTSISIKKMHNGEVRFYYERPGHSSGFQRMSFRIAENGVKLRIVQTAFDDNNNLVHQKPGQA